MRPLELTIEGFNSYREPATFSFDGRTLFGIVGPTGAGKSSILDAMLYALFGKTPRIERSTKMLINTASEMARIVFLFEVNGEVWEATRALRAKGQSQVLLRRADGSGAPISGESNVNAAIEELIGLDFKAFLSTVSLPQGEFNRFLHSASSERSKILKGIFRLDRVDRIRETAKRHHAELEGKVAALVQQGSSLPDDPDAELERLGAERDKAAALVDEVKEALPAVLKVEQDAQRSAEELDEIGESLSQLEALIASIPEPESLQGAADAAASAKEELDAFEKSGQQAAAHLSTAIERFTKVEAETGGKQWLDAVSSRLEERTRVEEELRTLTADLTAAQAAGEQSKKAQAEAAAAATAATAEVTVAQEHLDALRREHAAHLLRGSLVVGEACPVCAQEVGAVPKAGKVAGLSEAESRLTKAKAAEATALKALSAAEVALGVANERVQGLTARRDGAMEKRDHVTAGLAELVGQGVDANAELKRRSDLLAEAIAGVDAARTAKDAADQAERTARRSMEEAAKGIESFLRTMIRVCGVLSIDFEGTEPYSELPGIAKRAHEAALGRVDVLRARAEELRSAEERLMKDIEAFRARFDAQPQESASDVFARISQQAAAAEHAITRLKEAIASWEKTKEQISSLAERKTLFERAIADFTDARFTKFLLDGQRRLLARLGSEKLMELTGHYRFDEDGEFNVIDTRSGATRHPDTLSGGETFLASLALALALAEAVAMEGGQLGCFFLDEGFGSLDSESLDLALEGIERLATPGRVIGIISHVFSIQSRLDDLIVLEKDAEGSTVVVQDGGPIGYVPPMI